MGKFRLCEKIGKEPNVGDGMIDRKWLWLWPFSHQFDPPKRFGNKQTMIGWKKCQMCMKEKFSKGT